MPLNKLENFIKNTEGRILYVSPADLDSTDSILNTGNSLARPFKTIQRALIEAARFSYIKGNSNDETEKTTILLMPGEHIIDNRPGWSMFNDSGTAKVLRSDASAAEIVPADFYLSLESNFDLTQPNNHLYRFNSVNGGVIVPRGVSIVGLDLRKTKIRPKYVPNPTDSTPNSAIFRITGAGYLWQFSVFDGDELGLVYTKNNNFSTSNQATPTFSHHKLTVFEYADGVNEVSTYGITDLGMYYAKLSVAYGTGSGRDIDDKFPALPKGFEPQRPEYEIVGAFAADPLKITSIEAGSGGVVSNRVTVTTETPHGLSEGTPIRITGVTPIDGDTNYNISTKVSEVDADNTNIFYYNLLYAPATMTTPGVITGNEFVTIETDTVSGASPYIFNISMRSVWGMNGMHADGSKATGFRSMVVAQFTGVSLQKDDRAFVKYSPSARDYSDNIAITPEYGGALAGNSSSKGTVYHLDPDAIYRSGWESTHIKASNDAFIQIVSVFAIGYNKHFECLSGADMSITNSNSNFGQISLAADGFKKEAFTKDDNAYITHIIPPRAITGSEENIDWLTIDYNASNSATKLYLDGFTSEDIVPPILTQGYRVGARVGDKLYLEVGGTEYSANILMTDGATSSVKEYSVGAPSTNIFTLSSGTHTLATGEKVIIISDDGDLPENLRTNTVYYAIVPSGSTTTFKLAASESDASNDSPITVYGGTNLKVLSRVSDKVSGDIGHPVQWDGSQWYITTATGNTIYPAISSLTGTSEASYIKRIADTRSLDEKIYKIRVVVPKELSGSKTPGNGFVIQESSSTGYRGIDNTDFLKSTITAADDYDYNRNPRFIATCTFSSSTATVRTELPHNLTTGDSIIVRNVTDANNTVGAANSGYNGTHTVTIVDDMTFSYPVTSNLPGASSSNNIGIRTNTSPRFERNDLQSNLYIYRNEVIQEYVDGERDGIYHLYVANSGNSISEEFTDLKYGQNIVDLYPQLDRDNVDDSPESAKSYAKPFPLGEVVTNDLKKSITRETTDILLTKLGVGLDISSVADATTTTPDITFGRRHGLQGIVEATINTAGSGFVDGTYHNVKLLNDGTSNWDGATANIVVSGGAVGVVTIVSPGSGYTNGEILDLEGFSGSDLTISTTGISTAIGDVVQFTGAGTISDTYHRITAVGSATQISIARTTGDPVITSNHYAYVVGKSIAFTADTATGIVTATEHGLVAGNRVRIIDSSNNNTGDLIVGSRTGVNSLTISGITTTSGYILRHALSANAGTSDRDAENLGKRAFAIYGGETLTLGAGITATTTQFAVSLPNSGVGTMSRFPLGSYVQIDEEIMRVANNTLQGISNNELVVIRGALATRQVAHDSGSVIRKIEPKAIEFRRPSYSRASGHTFEYLGYGPGNYSTGLPQVQIKSLPEREEFLVQSQERSAGIVAYTGMNNSGDFFIGNQRKSASTGEETTFDTPIPTITGEDPSRLSAVFDEVTVKERIVVEGGPSNQVLSQFDGPVTFNGKTRFTNAIKIADETASTSPTSGALIVSGGVGIAKTLNIGSGFNFEDSDGRTVLRHEGGSTTRGLTLNIFGDRDGGAAANSGYVQTWDSDWIFGNEFTNANRCQTSLLQPTADGLTSTARIGFYTPATTSATNGSVLVMCNDVDVSTGDPDRGSNINFVGSRGNTEAAYSTTFEHDVLGRLTFQGCVSTASRIGAAIQVQQDNVGSANTNTGVSGRLQFFTTPEVVGTSSGEGILTLPVERMTIKGDGKVGIGITLPQTTLHVNGDTRIVGELQVTDDITAFYTSDQRLKDNVTPIDDPLAKVLSISGNTFDWNEKSNKSGHDVGLIAQEIEKVLPEAVTTRDNGYLAVDYHKVIPLLVEAIKDLSDKVEALEQKLSDK